MVLPDSLIIIQDGGAFVKGFCLTEGGVFYKWIAKDPARSLRVSSPHCRCEEQAGRYAPLHPALTLLKKSKQKTATRSYAAAPLRVAATWLRER